MISDNEFNRWLGTGGHDRRVLVELDYDGGTEYMADRRYIARPSGQSRRIYEGALFSESGFDSRLDNRLSIGEIEIVNAGYRDSWLSRAWPGHQIRFYLGDYSWPYEDFRLVMLATNGGIQSLNRERLTVAIADSHAVFDTPISVGKLPSGNPNPITLGIPFNVPAALESNSQHRYRVNDGAITSAAARVNGSVVSITGDYANGQFSMSSAPLGNLCVDPVEPNSTVQEIFTWVSSKYGVAVNNTNLAALPAYPLGLHYPSEVTGRQILTDAANSIGGYWRRNLLGELECFQLQEPSATADSEIMRGDIVEGGLTLIRRDIPASEFILNYNKNFSVTDRGSLAGGLENDPDLAEQLIGEWFTTSVTNTLAGYPSAEPISRESYLVNDADAATECARRALLRSVERNVWRVECRLNPVQVLVGDTVRITHPQWGFDQGKNALVINARRSLSNNNVELEVWL